MDQKLNILIINTDLPVFPGGMGCEYLHTTNLTSLAREVGLVSMLHTAEHQRIKDIILDKGVKVFSWENPWIGVPQSDSKKPSPLRMLLSFFYYLALSGLRRPFDTVERDFQIRNMAWPLINALASSRWDAFVVIQSSCGLFEGFLPKNAARILVLHDVRALVYERKARSARAISDKLSAWYEALQYRRLEKRFCKDFDLVITVSSTDERWVREHYSPNSIITVPLPVDGQYFRPMPGVEQSPSKVIFTGMMNHPPNEDAVCYFAHEVFPFLRRDVSDAEFWIVGRDPTERVKSLERLEHVKVTGFVPDIREHLAAAGVVVVPLRFGAGMRNKILEAWGMEKAVVSTTIGAEGLDYRDGENILIADRPRDMAERIRLLFQDEELRKRLGRKGREVIERDHDPRSLARLYYEAVSSAVKSRRGLEKPMRAAIDLRWMRPGFAGGIEDLSRAFVHELACLDKINHYKILLPSEVKYDFDLRNNKNMELLGIEGVGEYWRRLRMKVAGSLARRMRLDYRRTTETETLHFINRLDAEIALSVPGYIRFDLYPLRNVLIVPDIQHEYYPEFFSPQVLEERKRLYTDSILRADHICAISEFTRRTLIEKFGLPEERITTTHLAADPIFWPDSQARRETDSVLEIYRLSKGRYLFFPAKTWPHKNHATALKALKILRESYGLDIPLVCTGGEREAHPELKRLIGDLDLFEKVRFLGYCPKQHLPSLYEGAAALVFPSLFEGFGMPVLEAMWCGCPVVCSNSTSLPEIAGEAALLVDPLSPEALADGINRVITDSGLRSLLVERGVRQSGNFSWRRFTLQVVRTMTELNKRVRGC